MDVCEQSSALGEIGAGLTLSPNALMALRTLGVEEAPGLAGETVCRLVALRSYVAADRRLLGPDQ